MGDIRRGGCETVKRKGLVFFWEKPRFCRDLNCKNSKKNIMKVEVKLGEC